MTGGSTALLAVQAFTDSWSNALATVSVVNGPVVSSSSDLEGVSVGYQDADTPAIDGRFDPEGYRSVPLREQYTVNCLLTVRDGSKGITAATSRAFTILGLIGAAIATDPSLGGLLLHAHLGEWTLTQTQTEVGATARIAFGVDCDGYTTT